MKKRILTLFIVAVVGAGVMVGCTSDSENKDVSADGNAMQNEIVSDDQSQNEKVSMVRGTVDEIKDFMVVVTDSNRVSYGFTFDEKPEGLAEVSIGDTVIVTYTGTINEVDPFMGEVLSVEKQ